MKEIGQGISLDTCRVLCTDKGNYRIVVYTKIGLFKKSGTPETEVIYNLLPISGNNIYIKSIDFFHGGRNKKRFKKKGIKIKKEYGFFHRRKSQGYLFT
jgi:hypothetical protein